MNKEFFVVQRCWHSGPNVTPAVDYLRLFVTRRDAEEAAFHSAHAWARQQSPNDPSVKTLLLPPPPGSRSSSGDHGQKPSSSAASYGFVAKGTLFWIRSTYVTITDHCDHEVFGYAVVTEGVIGGTGNRNSRRGTEVSHGRVFVGSSAESRRVADEVCYQCATKVLPGCNSYVASLPIGKHLEYNSGVFLKEWPSEAHLTGPSLMSDTENHDKRGNHMLQELHNCHHQQAVVALSEVGSTSNKEFSVNPTSKRRRVAVPPASSWQRRDGPPPSDDEMVMS